MYKHILIIANIFPVICAKLSEEVWTTNEWKNKFFPPSIFYFTQLLLVYFTVLFLLRIPRNVKRFKMQLIWKQKKEGNHSGSKTNAMFIFYINSFDI